MRSSTNRRIRISWACEAAQIDVSGSFAIAILALIAILPEYVIESNLAWDAGLSYTGGGNITKQMNNVAANVTGANRLLIGLGWSSVILIYWVKTKKRLTTNNSLKLEITMLSIATIASVLIFIMKEIHVFVAVFLVTIFLVYLYLTSTQDKNNDPHLMGPSLYIGSRKKQVRRSIVIILFIYSAFLILRAAEPFLHSLIESGATIGISEFILIQWIAPLASESPEIIIALLFTLRGNCIGGITTLIASEVNQLTLLVGSTVGIFSLAYGSITNFPLNNVQSVEFILTAALSILALILISRKSIGWKSGLLLLIPFIIHLPITDPSNRILFVYFYLLMAGVILIYYLYRQKTSEEKQTA